MSDDKIAKTTVLQPDDDDLKSILQTYVQETTLITADDAAIAGKRETLPGIKGQRYEVGEILGAGGMGVVLQAFDKNLQRSVAMKVLQRARVTDGNHALRFIREAEITGGLEHPNIIPLHEMGLDKGSNAYYTMKQVKGETLKHILKQLKNNDPDYIANYPFSRLIEIYLSVCNAISLAHDRGVIHRDLKPENVMVGDYGEVLVIDWGLARRENDADPEAVLETENGNELEFVTQAGAVMGTPGFMSPEQARGTNVGPLSDVFSLGAILFNILTFRPPIIGKNLREVMINLLKGEIPTPEDVWRQREDGVRPVHLPNGQVPLGLSAVAMKALAIRPDNRYASVKELQQDVEHYQSGFATSAEQASLWRQMMLMIKRYKKSVAALTVIGMGIIMYGGFFTLRLKKDIAHADAQTEHSLNLLAASEDKRNDVAEVRKALKSKVPVIVRQARYKLENHETRHALELIEQAISLESNNATYYQLKGDILQNRFKFRQAAEAYRTAITLSGPSRLLLARKDASLALAQIPDDQFLELLQSLNQHLLDQKRYHESLNTLRQLWRKREPYLVTGQELIKSKKWNADLFQKRDILYGFSGYGEGKQNAICLVVKECDPYFDFREISGLGIKDLQITGATFFTGLDALVAQHDMHRLTVNGIKTLDFNDLRGVKIKSFNVTGDSIKNVAAMNDMGLLYLSLKSKGLTDESMFGFKGQEIRELEIENASITNLDFLAGLPLVQKVQIINSPVSDISVFDRIQPREIKHMYLKGVEIDDLMPIKKHTVINLSCEHAPVASLEGINLEMVLRLSLGSTKINNLEYLAKVECKNLIELNISNCPVRDLSPLKHMWKLSSLDISGTPVTDLSMFEGRPSLTLIMRNTKIKDIRPLGNISRLTLDISDSKVTDLLPLQGVMSLQLTMHNTGISDIPLETVVRLTELNADMDKLSETTQGALRKSRNLRTINGQAATSFWKIFGQKDEGKADDE